MGLSLSPFLGIKFGENRFVGNKGKTAVEKGAAEMGRAMLNHVAGRFRLLTLIQTSSVNYLITISDKPLRSESPPNSLAVDQYAQIRSACADYIAGSYSRSITFSKKGDIVKTTPFRMVFIIRDST